MNQNDRLNRLKAFSSHRPSNPQSSGIENYANNQYFDMPGSFQQYDSVMPGNNAGYMPFAAPGGYRQPAPAAYASANTFRPPAPRAPRPGGPSPRQFRPQAATGNGTAWRVSPKKDGGQYRPAPQRPAFRTPSPQQKRPRAPTAQSQRPAFRPRAPVQTAVRRAVSPSVRQPWRAKSPVGPVAAKKPVSSTPPTPADNPHIILCTVCNVNCCGTASYEQHQTGKNHLAKVAQKQMGGAPGAAVPVKRPLPGPATPQQLEAKRQRASGLQDMTIRECRLCDKKFLTDDMAIQHYQSKGHIWKRDSQLAEQPFSCAECKVSCSSQQHLDYHLAGFKHAFTVSNGKLDPNGPFANQLARMNRVKEDKPEGNGEAAQLPAQTAAAVAAPVVKKEPAATKPAQQQKPAPPSEESWADDVAI